MIKIIAHAFAEPTEAVVEVVYASTDETAILEKMATLKKRYPNDYLATYDLPLDTDLTVLPHYPSVAICPDDFSGGTS
ncbi:phosphoribosylaminoimidazole carboxylase [Streptococcus sp. S784/96/1]|uniref:phosphoribosylaminoimidazole carboxylase n=1 Tax=Streptococcus sp. S784/96/1 TaxID=2653499 RepID=UPI001386B496|nr:phosphoribosylaminoimidazole carboxylase [Streptococcus sp. S784/96/1]